MNIVTRSPANRRAKPLKIYAEAILKAQGGRCFYCGSEFGSFFMRRTKLRCVRLHWDHVVPYSYAFNNESINFVAACSECNHIKSNLMFDTIQQAKDYVRAKRAEKGYPLFELRPKERGEEKHPEVLQSEVSNGLLLEASQGDQVWVAIVRKCAWCGEPLNMTRQWKKYCNYRCAWNAWDERNPRQNINRLTP